MARVRGERDRREKANGRPDVRGNMNAGVHAVAGGHDIVPERSEQDAEEHDE